MDLLDVINPNKEFKRVFLRPKRQYYTPSESSAASVLSYDVRQESISGTDYVKQYVDEEDKKALEVCFKKFVCFLFQFSVIFLYFIF